MIEVKSPNDDNAGRGLRLFLAGSIEMGRAERWQDRVLEMLKDTEWIVFNPRRDNWDPSWEQSKDNPNFREQVDWELTNLDTSTVILMYFDPTTLSPISLLELGLFHDYCVVVCPKGFWRKGNVDIVCDHYGVPMFDTLEEAVASFKDRAIR